MQSKRVRGRPKRLEAKAGKEKLVDHARTILRSRPQIDLNRKELADAAGVTPALVTYYFHDQPSLIEAVAQPIVDAYLTELKALLKQNISVEKRFRQLVILFLRISRKDGQLIDSYINYVKRTSSSQGSFLSGAFFELSRFFTECEEKNYFRSTNIAFLQTLMWGACKTVAQTEGLNQLLFGTDIDEHDLEIRQADMIISLLIRGIGAEPLK